ncbi:phosphoglycerate kinase [Candidatus Erwinia haradaeae]|uniref:Phosphoglycerate kinase n=1 Tax=Candidatus Erwinia haradaeae TaxID=1922217 RepID=A0A451D2D3_9GAMM|nr:phosphoglycerate kinase [Candidatus Erwinia haradaeae]VFP79777.1 Phosphoglycerate kinase [Candidatus Erwinia haradaeae]
MSMLKMTDIDLSGKCVLVRSDLNVPIKLGKVVSDARICAALPTIIEALEKNARVIVASHLGRPVEGIYNKDLSLLPVVNSLKEKLGKDHVTLCKDYLHGIHHMTEQLIVLENVRFNKGEQQNDDYLSKQYAALCDIFIMDAFGTAHRVNSSTYGVGNYAIISCAGKLLLNEITALEKVLDNPARPMIAIVGGSKISTKINVLQSLANIADTVIVGGGIANTFIAIDHKVGKSLYEPDYIPLAQKLRDKFLISIPVDVRIGTKYTETALSTIKKISAIQDGEAILDVGNETSSITDKILKTANTIIWNGPVGVFEFPNFCQGTKMIANSIAESNAFSIAGGGDTLAVIDLFKIKDKISYISTGGGAFLQFVSGEDLPVISMLKNRAKMYTKK